MQTCEIYCRKSINKKITRQPRRRLSKKLDRAAKSAAGSANWKLENACAYLWLPLWVYVWLCVSPFPFCIHNLHAIQWRLKEGDWEGKRGTSPLPEHEPGFDNFLPLPGLFSVFVLLPLLITLFLRFTFYFYIDFIFIESFCSSLKFVFG